MATRELKVKITADTVNAEKGIDRTSKKVGGLPPIVKKAGMALMGAFAAKQLMSGISNLVKGLTNTADRLLDLQDITGISTDVLQEYEYVARIAGVNTEALANAAMGLTQRMARATTESSPLNIAMRDLGVNLKDTQGAMRGGAEVMDDVIKKLSDMDNVTERNVLGSQIFSGAWKDMAPILSKGSEGIEQLRREAREMGFVMDDAMLNKANEARENMERLNMSTETLGRELAILLIPTVNNLSAALTEVVQDLNLITNAMRAVGESENLSGWDKFITKVKVFTGAALGNSKMMAEGLIVVTEAIEEQTQRLEEAGKATDDLNSKQNNVVATQRTISDIQQEIKETQEAYLTATSDQQRAIYLDRLSQLEDEIEHLDKVAERHLRILNLQRAGIPDKADTPSMMGALAANGIELETQALLANNAQLEKRTELIDKTREAAENNRIAMEEWEQIAVSAAASIGASFTQMAMDGNRSVSEVIKGLLAQVTAQLIAKIVASIPFPANLAVAAGAGSIAGALFSKIPAFADGGKVTSPTLAMFGEYPGARTNPEYALREDQLRNITGGGGGQLTARVSGQDLLFALNEAQRRNKASF